MSKYVSKNRHPSGYTMASYLVDGKTVVSMGTNDYQKTHAKTPQNGKYILPCHAEIKVLAKYIIRNKKISKDLSLYVVGLTMGKMDNFVISSKPCESCQRFIKSVGIRRVVYVDNIEGQLEIKEMVV
jgi:deoxycytidylate deaminase